MAQEIPDHSQARTSPRKIRWRRRRRAGQGAEHDKAVPLPKPPTLPEEEASAHEATLRDAVQVTCIDFCPEQCQFEEVHDPQEFLTRSRPAWSKVRWIDVHGIRRRDFLEALADRYSLHPLAVADMLRTDQRPKAEDYPAADDRPGRLFVIARMARVAGDYLYNEQVSFFLGRTTLITFHERQGDLFAAIRERLRNPDSRLRQGDVGLLFYALLDAGVEHMFPILEEYSNRLEALERAVLKNPRPTVMRRLHRLRRELLLLRRATWSMRELLNGLLRDRRPCLSETAQVYLRDVHNHLVQALDLLETYREFLSGLTDTYMSVVSNRMNEVMKTLTIISTIFVPLTFVAGVYGMNLHIPEAEWPWLYPAFWVFALTLASGMLYWFRRRGWI